MEKENLNTERRILDAAKDVFKSKGFAGARMQDIADKAEINKAMLHYYFRNKESLFVKVFFEIRDEFLNNLLKFLNEETPFLELIPKIIKTYTEFIEKQPEILVFMLNEIYKNREMIIDHEHKSFLNNRLKENSVIMETKALKNLQKYFKEKNEKDTEFIHFFIDMIAMIIMPNIAKPIIMSITGFSEEAMNQLLKERENHIINSSLKLLKK